MKNDDNMNEREKVAHGIMWFLIWAGLGLCLYLAGKDGVPLISLTFK